MLTGQCHEFFCFMFFHDSSSPKPLKITPGSFRFVLKIRGNIHKSRCTAGVHTTTVKLIHEKNLKSKISWHFPYCPFKKIKRKKSSGEGDWPEQQNLQWFETAWSHRCRETLAGEGNSPEKSKQVRTKQTLFYKKNWVEVCVGTIRTLVLMTTLSSSMTSVSCWRTSSRLDVGWIRWFTVAYKKILEK
jgi:hypothetical protein